MVTYDDFTKLDLRVGTIVEAAAHPNADRLVVLQVDIGAGEHRQVVAGIRKHYTDEQLVGRQIVVLVNLEPRELRGVTSHGMLLAASDADANLCLVGPAEKTIAGSQVR